MSPTSDAAEPLKCPPVSALATGPVPRVVIRYPAATCGSFRSDGASARRLAGVGPNSVALRGRSLWGRRRWWRSEGWSWCVGAGPSGGPGLGPGPDP